MVKISLKLYNKPVSCIDQLIRVFHLRYFHGVYVLENFFHDMQRNIFDRNLKHVF